MDWEEENGRAAVSEGVSPKEGAGGSVGPGGITRAEDDGADDGMTTPATHLTMRAMSAMAPEVSPLSATFPLTHLPLGVRRLHFGVK